MVQRLVAPAGSIFAARALLHLLEHRWYLSERAGRDLGHEAALADFQRSGSV